MSWSSQNHFVSLISLFFFEKSNFLHSVTNELALSLCFNFETRARRNSAFWLVERWTFARVEAGSGATTRSHLRKLTHVLMTQRFFKREKLSFSLKKWKWFVPLETEPKVHFDLAARHFDVFGGAPWVPHIMSAYSGRNERNKDIWLVESTPRGWYHHHHHLHRYFYGHVLFGHVPIITFSEKHFVHSFRLLNF